MENRRALGRGLEQLFNSDNLDIESMERRIYETTPSEDIVNLSISELRPNPYQPRKVFKDESLRELADSIKEHGVFQPIIVKKSIKGYEIVAGERRYRACKLAGVDKIPAIIRQFTDEEMMEIALLENLQRENLSSIEEAEAYRKMIDTLQITQEELAKRIGKSRSHITNILGLLRLPKEVQIEVANGTISMGHARVLSKLESEEKMIELAHQIIQEKLPVRDVESIATKPDMERRVKIHRQKTQSDDFRYVEDLLRDKLDTKVKIKEKKVEIHFSNVADLNRILEILNVKE